MPITEPATFPAVPMGRGELVDYIANNHDPDDRITDLDLPDAKTAFDSLMVTLQDCWRGNLTARDCEKGS